MAEIRHRLRVFVASPGDTQAERACLEAVIGELNRGIADDLELVLELVRWETHSWPGVGADAQDVINQQISVPDIFIGVFWKRIGTPTLRAPSGSAEELHSALSAWREGRGIEILIYFNEAPHTPTFDSMQQLREVLAFRQNLQRMGFFVGTYNGPVDFEAKIRQALTQVIRRWPTRPLSEAPSYREEPGADPVPKTVERWHRELAAGRLDTVFDPRRGSEFYTFIAVARQVLQEKRFRRRTVESTAIALIELLSNVARHADSQAWLRIEIQDDYFRSISIRVADNGTHFSLENVIFSEFEEFETDGREHGLLLVNRLSGDQWSRNHSELGGTHEVGCEIYETPLPASGPSNLDFVGHIQYRDDFPREIWLGPEHFIGKALDFIIHASKSDSLRWRNLLFGPLLDANPAVIVVDFLGQSQATVWVQLHFHFMALIERCLPERLNAKQIVLLAQDTSRSISEEAQVWAARHGLRFFTEESACVDYLNGTYGRQPPDRHLPN